MELVHTEVDKATGVVYQLLITQDESRVRGNALCSGDSHVDRQYEDEILQRLDSGDVWAWARTECRAILNDKVGHDYLGACSYTGTAEFIQPGGYWDDMKHEALADLQRQED